MFIPRQWIRKLLASPNVTRFYRRLLRGSPRLQEALGLCLYRYRKFAIRNAASLMPTENELQAEKRKRNNDHQFLVDISGAVSKHDRTGVYRVVFNLLQELLKSPPVGFCIEPVYADASGKLRYARNHVKQLHEIPHDTSLDPVVTVQTGDVFFSADLYFPYPFPVLRNLKLQGLRIIFTVHDMIPLSFPQYFMKLSKLGLEEWLLGATEVADAIVCVSRAVADELQSWIHEHPGYRKDSLPIGYFHHGADPVKHVSISERSDSGLEVLVACKARLTFLMVGTVAPHKGYEQVLAAIGLIWRAGYDCNLIIVGKEGWRMQAFADEFDKHPECDRRLFWLKNSDDRLLTDLYTSSSCLIAASFTEGFGLPLIEAARHGLPIIARDIPVFREVAGNYAFFFRGISAVELATSIQDWIGLYVSGNAPSSLQMPWQTWRESAAQLLHVILDNDWYITDATALNYPARKAGLTENAAV